MAFLAMTAEQTLICSLTAVMWFPIKHKSINMCFYKHWMASNTTKQWLHNYTLRKETDFGKIKLRIYTITKNINEGS